MLEREKEDSKDSRTFVVIENINEGMNQPCMLDIKLGSKPYNPKKIERQKWKASESCGDTHGFRMCGYQGYRRALGQLPLDEGEVFYVDKYVGRKVKAA